MEENNSHVAGHVGVDSDDVNAGFVQRLEGRLQFITREADFVSVFSFVQLAI